MSLSHQYKTSSNIAASVGMNNGYIQNTRPHTEHQALHPEHQALHTEYQALHTEHQALHTEHQALQGPKQSLATREIKWEAQH